MIQKIWTSFRYGNRKTKLLILSVAALFLLTAICIIMVIITKSPLWALGSAFSLILTIIFMQSVSFKSSGQLTPLNNKNEESKSKAKIKENKAVDNSKENDDEKVETDETGYLSALRQSDIKQIMVSNKVRKDHKPVMIDLCKSENIKQCPAYIWTAKGYFYMLLLEKQPRRVRIPKIKVNKITYNPGVIVKRLTDYQEFQKPSFVSLTFGSFLPTHYEEIENSKTVYKKNLYVLEPDIMFTNTSIKSVIRLLKFNVTVEDKITCSEKYSEYFKEAYKINLLWKDGIYTTQEFKSEIKKMLQNMAESHISSKYFLESMKQMVTGRLVTKEYADYYINYRKSENKNKNKKIKKSKKR